MCKVDECINLTSGAIIWLLLDYSKDVCTGRLTKTDDESFIDRKHVGKISKYFQDQLSFVKIELMSRVVLVYINCLLLFSLANIAERCVRPCVCVIV